MQGKEDKNKRRRPRLPSIVWNRVDFLSSIYTLHPTHPSPVLSVQAPGGDATVMSSQSGNERLGRSNLRSPCDGGGHSTEDATIDDGDRLSPRRNGNVFDGR